ncbi:MAG: hypothetical protein WD988_04190 [Candidatus Curtissbacteria bacterium]
MARGNKLFIILTFGLFGFLYLHLAKNMLTIKPDGWYVGHINLYGDLVFHLTLINKFQATGQLNIDNPIFSGAKVGYPILADLITAKIANSTSINFALFITTFLAGLLGIYVARLFIKNFIRNEKTIFLTLLLFFINGGLGFYYFFQDLFFSQKPLGQFLLSMPREYTDIKENGYWWINTYLAYFLPQRPFLFAFPITLIILILLYKGLEKSKRKYFILAGFLTGVLPLVQVHSLFLIFLISAMLCPLTILKKKLRNNLVKNWLVFALITTLLAIPILNTISEPQSLFRYIRLQPGWTSNENIIWFWFKNLGLFGPALIASVIWIYRKNRDLFYMYLPFLGVFVLSNIYIFQPWDFDNSKLLIYWFFASCILVAYFLVDEFFSENYFKKTIGTIIVSLMIFSGALDLIRTFTPQTNYKIFSNSQLEVAEIVKRNTAQDAVFLTASNHNHPIPALAGRSTLVGFEGWLWSHGTDFTDREIGARTIYLGGNEAESKIRQYRINYVTIGPLERVQFSINDSYFEKYSSQILAPEWHLYDVSSIWTNDNR